MYLNYIEDFNAVVFNSLILATKVRLFWLNKIVNGLTRYVQLSFQIVYSPVKKISIQRSGDCSITQSYYFLKYYSASCLVISLPIIILKISPFFCHISFLCIVC